MNDLAAIPGVRVLSFVALLLIGDGVCWLRVPGFSSDLFRIPLVMLPAGFGLPDWW